MTLKEEGGEVGCRSHSLLLCGGRKAQGEGNEMPLPCHRSRGILAKATVRGGWIAVGIGGLTRLEGEWATAEMAGGMLVYARLGFFSFLTNI